MSPTQITTALGSMRADYMRAEIEIEACRASDLVSKPRRRIDRAGHAGKRILGLVTVIVGGRPRC
jgi:hypothetical protein